MKLAFFILLSFSWAASSKPDAACQNVHLADIGWTDVSATTAVTAELLKALGYTPKISLLSLPVALASLDNGQVDVFLGNWMPSQEADLKPYLKHGNIENLGKNLEGARYTLAVPEYVYNAGVKHFDDLKKFAPNFNQHIYGIEAGNDGNRQILKMLSQNAFGLQSWKLIESSEQAMLTSVKQSMARKDWVVFLGWAPHPMNLLLNLKYLDGGDAFFGANYGAASVSTLTRKNLRTTCPALGHFLTNLKFTVEEESELMALILEQNLTPQKAAQAWLGKHPQKAMQWTGDKESLAKYLFGINNFSDSFQLEPIPLGAFAERVVNHFTKRYSNESLILSKSIEAKIQALIGFLLSIPALLLILFISAVIYSWRRSVRLGFGVCLGLMVILNLGLWTQTIQTLVLVLLATLISCLLGIPLGVLAARSRRALMVLRPILDLMQTLPSFLYLIPALMLFGLGVVPGLISTLIFAIAAPIRMTHLGLSGVPQDLLEVGKAFGASRWQTFWKIELPHALPSILTGLNQCILLSLSMVVIAALVGADGLGTSVVRALNTVNLKQGFEAGLAIVILALILDRTLQPRPTREKLP
ncbi:MAG: choline ABC transporter substrate-binding protein [Myxococcota bacterium]